MLTDKIRLSGPETFEPEDYLSSSLGVIFPDDITNQHGDASTSVIYLSPAYGSITLSLADPQGEDSRKLFSHFLWNAGLQLAEFIEEDSASWPVRGKRALELGAGTGLAGMVAALSGAREVVVSDYPAEEVLENIRVNVRGNVDVRREEAKKEQTGVDELGTGGKVEEMDRIEIGVVHVEGHSWGVLDDTFSLSNKHAFDTLLVADCLWMPWQHGNLHQSIAWFLNDLGRAWVVAGFHTGREKMRGFYEEKALREAGLEIERIWERNAEGGEREWVSDRGAEDVTERKRWLVVGILKRRV